jgi:hypothetical protein
MGRSARGRTADPQEAVEKYQQSKRELDEVVAQMESLVRCVVCRTHRTELTPQ